MDPLTVSLAAATFISLTNDLIELGKDLNDVRKRIKHAPVILQNFEAKIRFLEGLLHRLSDPVCLAAADDFLQPAIDDLRAKVRQLTQRVSDLKKRRLTFALNYDKLKGTLDEVEVAMYLVLGAAQLDGIQQLARLVQQPSLSTNHTPLELTGEKACTKVEDCWSSIPARREYKTAWSITIRPWFLAQLWHFTFELEYRFIKPALRFRALHSEESRIVRALKAGDVVQAHILLDIGVAHPTDVVVCADGTSKPLLLFAVRSPQPRHLCHLFFNKSKVAEDLEMIRAVAYIWYGPADPLSTYKLIIEQSAIDLSLDWPSPCGADSGLKFSLPREPEALQWILERQRSQGRGAQILPTAALLNISLGERVDFPVLFALHGLSWPSIKFDCLQQDVKNWILHAMLGEGLHPARLLRGSDDLIVRNITAALRSGADPTAMVQGDTAAGTLLKRATRLIDISWPMTQAVFDAWLQLLGSCDIDVKQYLEEDSKASNGHLSSEPYHYMDHLIGIRGYSYDTNTQSLSCTFGAQYQPTLSRRTWAPGAFVDDLVPDIMFGERSDEQDSQWRAHEDVVIPFELRDEDFDRHFGLDLRLPFSETQDDHGFVFRSLRRSSAAGLGRPRSHSQPRPLGRSTWQCMPSYHVRWWDKVHCCPFDPLHRLHWRPGSIHDPFIEEMGLCHKQALRHPEHHEMDSRTLEDVWHAEHEKLWQMHQENAGNTEPRSTPTEVQADAFTTLSHHPRLYDASRSFQQFGWTSRTSRRPRW